MNEKHINFNKIKDLTDILISDNYNIDEYFITNFIIFHYFLVI